MPLIAFLLSVEMEVVIELADPGALLLDGSIVGGKYDTGSSSSSSLSESEKMEFIRDVTKMWIFSQSTTMIPVPPILSFSNLIDLEPNFILYCDRIAF